MQSIALLLATLCLVIDACAVESTGPTPTPSLYPYLHDCSPFLSMVHTLYSSNLDLHDYDLQSFHFSLFTLCKGLLFNSA